MCSDGRLSATALDLCSVPPGRLPVIAADLAGPARPRGLSLRQTDLAQTVTPADFQVPLGVAGLSDFDHDRRFLDESILRLVAVVSSQYLNSVGFTPAFTARTGLNRMSVEKCYSLNTCCCPGDFLWADTKVTGLARKSLVLCHDIYSGSVRIARVEHVLVVVDLKTRRIVTIPRDQLAFADGPPDAVS